VLSLLTGARTEELRELSWPHVVAFDADRQAWCPVDEVGWEHTQFAVYVWRSVRKTGDTKTVKSRRSLRLPDRCVDVLEALKIEQNRATAGAIRSGKRLVFCTRTGTALSAGNVRRDFRAVLDRAGLVGREWAPRELRHSFVSLLSAHDVPIENISRPVGHTNTVVTERVYRKQIRPVI
jgi:integrase